jgi:hypothetical protein
MEILLKRLDLDLKFRLPERVILEFGKEILVLTEPSFYHIEFVNTLNQPLLRFSRGFLYYVRFEIEEISDLLRFLSEVPSEILFRIESFCNLYFKQNLDLEDRILGHSNSQDLKGLLRAKAIHSRERKHRETYDLLFNRLFEGLGVHLKATPHSATETIEQGEEVETPRDFAWIPLVQAINPKAYEHIRNGLTYIPKDDEISELDRILNESERMGSEEARLKSPEEKDQIAIEVEKAERKGRTPLSLVTSRADYVRTILQFAKFGYLQVSDKMDTKEYMKRVMENSPEISLDRTKLKENVEVQPEDQINIKGRWKGLKKRQQEGTE